MLCLPSADRFQFIQMMPIPVYSRKISVDRIEVWPLLQQFKDRIHSKQRIHRIQFLKNGPDELVIGGIVDRKPMRHGVIQPTLHRYVADPEQRWPFPDKRSSMFPLQWTVRFLPSLLQRLESHDLHVIPVRPCSGMQVTYEIIFP